MKRFLFIVTLNLVIYFISATPTEITPFKVMQPNGDSITIIQHGDEYGTWYETLDGYVVEKNSSNYWVYVNTNTNGNLVLTNQIVNNVSLPTGINLINVFNAIEDNRMDAYEILHNDSIYFPDLEDAETVLAIQQEVECDTIRAKAPAKNKGSINVLTILIQFQDVKFEHPTTIKSYFEYLMEGVNFKHPSNGNVITGSVKEYWEEVSYGQLLINSTVVGPYTASDNLNNYKTIRNSDNSLDASNVDELIKEAINEATKDVNMRTFDNDNDKYVDFVHIVYAGSMDSIWPHNSHIKRIYRDNVWVSKYIITSEKERNQYASIGIICHEMGHAFGAPDFYDRNKKIDGLFDGTGSWDLMANGDKNNNRNSPAHPNPYIKTAIYGWATAKELSGNNREYILSPSELDGNSIYKLSTSTPGEYYLLENRQDENLKGTGLVIYHVNSNNIGDVYDPSVNTKHPQNLYVVDASNNLAKPTGSVASYGTINSSNATFKNTPTNNIFFTSQTKPSNCAWNGTLTQNKDVCFIREVLENGEKRIKFTLNPTIEGPDILCDSAIYSVANVPAGATIEWGYEPDSIPTMSTPFVIGEGQGTSSVWFKRGEKRTISSGVEPEPGIPVRPTPTSVVPNSQTLVIEPYRGVGRLYAKISSGHNTYRISKDVYMPQDMKIADTEYGTADDPLRPNRSYDFSLRHPVASAWESNVRWTISDEQGSRTATGNSVWVSTGNSIAVSLRVEFVGGCSDTRSDSKIFQVVSNVGLMFTNPATDFAEINVVGAEEYDSDVRTMSLNTNTSYMGTYRLELWHDVYGKVREMDVAENTPSVTMNLVGLNSGIYVLRLIIDNQVVETSQMIIR